MATKESSALDGVKKSLGKAADLTSLKIKLTQTQNKRKAAYQRLGELAYSKHRPRPDAVTEDIDNAIAAGAKDGMISMDQSILGLYREGKITKETALEFADNTEQMRRAIG